LRRIEAEIAELKANQAGSKNRGRRASGLRVSLSIFAIGQAVEVPRGSESSSRGEAVEMARWDRAA
jgi:hypothetical protein